MKYTPEKELYKSSEDSDESLHQSTLSIMKYRGAHTIPSSVALWLEQQLEERGIDSGVYARYVLNFLRDDSVDLSDLPHIDQGRTKKRTRFNSCNLEELKKNVVVDCLALATDQAIEIERLVDELCIKLKDADNGRDSFLKEKTTNFEDIFDIELPEECVNVASSYYPTFPSLTKESVSSSWSPKNYTARSCGRGWWCGLSGGGSPKVALVKRKENKENVCLSVGLARGRMRSRSTVKQPGGGGFGGLGCGSSHRGTRQVAKSLDRKDDEVVVRYVKNEIKGRKAMSSFGEERDAKMSRTPGRKEKIIVDVLPSDFDRDLPMDFQQLLQSPADDLSFYRQPRLLINPNALQPNFIQCGTNITSSIWTETSEKMEEEDVPLLWESTKWSDARGSILSSAWKRPSSYQEDPTDSLGNKQAPSLPVSQQSDTATTATTASNNTSQPSGYREKKPVQVIQADPKQEAQEEDLLTSMKTHFRPIKDEEGSRVGYKDGSSFDIANNFEQVKYRRSESGAFYLGDDSKYFEFKRAGSTDGFVPKFKVRQSEKFCQTEDLPSDVESQGDTEEDWPSDEMKYWGSSERLDDEDNDDDGNETSSDVAAVPSTTIQLSGWVTAWPVSSAIWSNNMGDDDAKSSSWLLGNGKEDFESVGGRNEHYVRLRNELTEDGEELLSDLSSIHLFLDTDRLDDAKPLAQRVGV